MKSRVWLLACFVPLVAALHVPATPQDVKPEPPTRLPRIGILGYGTEPALIAAFKQGLAQQGFVEGQSVVIEYRASEAQIGDLSSRASELARLPVDAILAIGTPSVVAAKKATTTTPVVMVSIGVDPVRLGIVESLGRPGGNVTGVAALGTEIWPKRLQLLKELLPKVHHIAVLWNPTNPSNALAQTEMRDAAAAAEIKISFVAVSKASDLEPAFDEVSASKSEALVSIWDAITQVHAKAIADFAVRRHLPTFAANDRYTDAGFLLSYGAGLPDQFKQAARYVARILRGTRPAELPVEQPMVFDLVVNRKTAKALGLEIPPTILVLADRVIE